MFSATVRTSFLRLPRQPIAATQQVYRFSTTFTFREATQEPLPYFVYRSKTNNLPVYEEAKSGGTQLQTRIRKVEGNIEALRQALIENLRLQPERVWINSLTKHVLVKGHMKQRVEKFLREQKF
ncbi:mitochondrial large subunit ribosomal protein-domain-containing protein [Sphaerosporella brunnea]|uniref:Large ribosomal subunit protein mL49 n=1 Tax=Sphaerosporella brunnea TaxID=1250544 RepID=A0A5J5F1N4_9PEZI|nr:mitochondrial large subunit ribosomal protein-domain-containing protein [Sphaerosporella brunnea]